MSNHSSCPTCGSTDKNVRNEIPNVTVYTKIFCGNAWHSTEDTATGSRIALFGSPSDLADAPSAPPAGDGSCDYCGKVPAIAMPTVFCDECSRKAMKWAEQIATFHWHDDDYRVPVASGNHYPSLYEVMERFASSRVRQLEQERDTLTDAVEDFGRQMAELRQQRDAEKSRADSLAQEVERLSGLLLQANNVKLGATPAPADDPWKRPVAARHCGDPNCKKC